MFSRNMTDNVHQMIQMHIRDNGKEDLTAVDGTLGNGFDLEFLNAQKEISTIVGFDIQQRAIEVCSEKVKDSKKVVHLIQDSHQHLDKYINQNIDIAMFNLGYLPGGDKGIVTQAGTTLIALEKTINLLSDNGLLVVMTYPGHEEGRREHDSINEFFKLLHKKELAILKLSVENVKKPCPNLFLIVKKI